MKKFHHNKSFQTDAVQIHVDPPLISLIKSKLDLKTKRDDVNIKLRRNPTPEKMDIYELKMDLFDNSDPYKLLLFIQNFKMMIEALVMIIANVNIQYSHNILRGELLCEFYYLCIQIGSMSITHLNQFILDLGTYFNPENVISKKTRMMHHRTRKICKLKVRCYAACTVELNKYLTVFP